MRRSCKKRCVLESWTIVLAVAAAVLIGGAGLASAQVISPLQSGAYVPCVTGVRDMAAPPPGLFVLWYNVFVDTDKFIDRNGNEVSSLALSEVNPSLPNIDLSFDVSAIATVPSLFWVSNFKLLGGARYMVGAAPSYVSADGMVFTEMGGGAIDTTITSFEQGTISGWGDLFVVPVGLSWGLEQFDITAVYGFYAPTGKYETGADDNIGLGFWTHQFQGYGYWYPVADKSTAIMLGLTYELTGNIKDTDTNPGDRFTLEWGVSQYLTEQFEVSVQGGHNWQITDDSGSDVFWDSSVHDGKSTIAFNVGFWPYPNWLYISGKYAFDFAVTQRFANDMWMINLIFLTNVLTGE